MKMTEKISVFDKPMIKTQRFTVSIPSQRGRITVIRKVVKKKIHHMGCIDGLPNDHQEEIVDYEIFREVDGETRQKAINAVEEELIKND